MLGPVFGLTIYILNILDNGVLLKRRVLSFRFKLVDVDLVIFSLLNHFHTLNDQKSP